MAVCTWCHGDMSTVTSCVVDVFHQGGRRFDMIPFGKERGGGMRGRSCGDCGVARGGWHHPGCDMQRCPACGHQMMSCGCEFDEDGPDSACALAEPLGVDGNGMLTERVWLGDQEVIIHQDDVPASDITTVQGIPCTTALRTVIDLAPEITTSRLCGMVGESLDRGLFTVDEAWQRLGQPDMADRRGAELLRRALPPPTP